MSTSRPLVVFAALNGALAVALGAFAAHGASPGVKALLTTGASYQLTHALFALACTALAGRLPARLVIAAGWIGAIGGLIFALALSAIALLNLRAMGAVAPIGGTLMIGAWLLAAYAAIRSHSDRS